jgi:structural maintenance of chromosome 4
VQGDRARLTWQDGHARSEATAANTNFDSELDSNRSKVAELEKKLVVEEAELDEIRDALKDKTDVFTQQIEVKQRELEPWTAKISEKQSAIDVATSERDLLVQKATSAQAALEEAKARVQQIKEGDGEKQAEYAQLNKEKGKLERAVQRAEARVQEITAHIDELRNKVSAQRAKTDEAKSSLVADRTENAVLGSLNKLKAQGRIKGFHVSGTGPIRVIDQRQLG